MHYQNFIKRFVLRKDFLTRAKGRIKRIKRRNTKNEFDDIAYLYDLVESKPNTIFDCGANIGFVTHKFHTLFPNCNVFAFEPNPVIFEKLNQFYSQNNHIHCFNLGISDSSGKLLFNINKNSGTSSFLNPNEYHKNNIASRNITVKEVKVTSIDDIMKSNNVNFIDVLKLDIEGFEIKALEGIKNLEDKVALIFAEVNLIPTYEGQPLIEDVISYARRQGFNVVNFYGINENKNRQASITNLLFISNRFKKKLIEKGYKGSFGY